MAFSTPTDRRRFPSSRSLADRADCDYLIKTILLGDLGVGKTTFLHTYLNGHCPTAGAVHNKGAASGNKTIHYHGKRVKMTLWDTAGQERYRSLTASYYRGAHACVVLYNVNNEESFENVTNWLESVQDYSESFSDTVTLLVGVKSSKDTSGIKVDQQRAQNLASHHQIPYFEVDYVSDPQGLDFVMNTLVTLVMTKAEENHHLSQTIRPYNTKLEKLAQKSKHSGLCSACCSV